MPRTKYRPQPPFERSPDGFMEERRTIVVAHHWPNEGYGCGKSFDSMVGATEYARSEACAVEASDIRAEIHIIETDVRTTVVRAPKT